MTLALYGKSRRRQGGLVLAALLAILVATVGGVSVITSAFAHHPELRVTRTCDTATVHFDFVGPNQRTYTIEHRPNGSSAWTQIAQFQVSGIADDVYPAITKTLPATDQYRATINTGESQTVNLANYPLNDCVKLIIKKVVSGPGADSNETFTAAVDNTDGTSGEASGLTFSASTPNTYGWTENNATDDFEVTEAVASGYAVVASWHSAGTKTCPAAGAQSWDTNTPAKASGGSLNDLSNGDTVTVCFWNVKVPTVPQTCQDAGYVMLDKLKPDGNDAGTAWDIDDDGTPDGMQVTANGAADGNVTWNSGSYPIALIIVKAGSGPVAYKSYDPAGGTAGSVNNDGLLNSGGQEPAISHIEFCSAQTGKIIVKKVKDTTAGVPAADGSVFSGSIDGSTTWGPITFGGSTAPGATVSTGNHTVSETSTQNGWTPVGWKVYPNGSDTGTVCSTNKNDYQANAGSSISNVAVVANQTTVVCVMNTKSQVVVTPSISKVKHADGMTGGFAYWTIGINNSGSTVAQDIYIEDSGATFVSVISGGSCTDQSFADGDGMQCSVNAGETLLIKVSKPVPAATCQPQTLNNTASAWVGTSNTGTSIGSAGGNGTTEYTISGNTQLCGQPSVVKTDVNGGTSAFPTTNPADIRWKIRVNNPADAAGVANITVRDQNIDIVSGPTYAGGANCTGTLDSASGAACTLPLGASVEWTVAPDNYGSIARTCPDQQFPNTAEYAPTPVTGGVPTTWTNAEGPTITLQGNPALCNRNVQVCKVVVGNGDGVAIGAFSYGFDIRPAGGSNISGSNSAAEPNPDLTDGANGTEVCVTKQVPTDKAFDVAEWASRPAGWTDDAANGYPKYSINGGAQVSNNTTTQIAAGTSDVKVTFYNKATPTTKSIRFSKYICETYGNVPANQGPGGQDDIGNPVEPGKTHSDLGPEVPAGAGDATASGPYPGCTLATEPWDFRIFTSDRSNGSGGTLLQTVTVTGSQVVALEADALAETLEGPGAYVEEVFKPDYGFGIIKCYTDHLNDDNWEWLDFSGGIPAGEVNCVAFNVPGEKQILITKYFVNTGSYQPTANDIPTFTLDPSADTSCEAPVLNGDQATVVCTVPYDWDGTVTETPKPGWRETACNFEALVTAEYSEYWTFCNEPFATVVIVKVDGTNQATGPLWDFTISPSLSDTDGNKVTSGQADTGTNFSVNVLLDDSAISVNEVLDGGPASECSSSVGYYTTAVVPADTTPNTPGETITFTFSNVPCGILGTGGLIIEKYLDINGDGDANDAGEGPLSGWTFTTTGGGIPGGNQVRQTNASGQILEYIAGFDGGTVLNVTESAQAGYTIKRVTLDNANVGSSLSNNVTIVAGQIRVIRYFNQPLGSIKVNKATYSTVDGITNPTPQDRDGWKITVKSAACGINQFALTDAAGNATFSNLPLCTDYVVAEDLTAPGASGYSPVGAASVANVTPGISQATQVNFVNEKRSTTPPPCSGPCRNPETPTPTPTTPTATPVTPTNTPVPPTSTPTKPTDPTSTPTSVSTQLGERTPGPGGPTPIAPSTGSGLFGGSGSGINIVLVVAGLLALTSGLSVVALGRKRR